ncbi:hypothetical protein [Actinomadura craniellae]|uniref:hypothetical protein n=1 Tax=Actinomadura craniellae TaxID=2231787 RepID=UPI001314E0A4|nr:hypothetical protein [Actinomadura craniellae]
MAVSVLVNVWTSAWAWSIGAGVLLLTSIWAVLAWRAAREQAATPAPPAVEASGPGAVAIGGDNHGPIQTSAQAPPARPEADGG